MIPRLRYTGDAVGISMSSGLVSVLFVTDPLPSSSGSSARSFASALPVWFSYVCQVINLHNLFFYAPWSALLTRPSTL
jgi:hypothetical protein